MIHEFPSLPSYLNAFKHNPDLAVIGITDVAAHLGIGRAAVEQRLARGSLDGVRINGSLYVIVKSISALIDHQESQVRAVQDRLEGLATRGETIFYEELMNSIGLVRQKSADRKKMGVILGDISTRSYEEKGVMLSVIVIYKGADYPADSFYGLARNLGIEIEDYDTFHIEETKRVFKAYKRKAK